jgi:hypothetical protein
MVHVTTVVQLPTCLKLYSKHLNCFILFIFGFSFKAKSHRLAWTYNPPASSLSSQHCSSNLWGALGYPTPPSGSIVHQEGSEDLAHSWTDSCDFSFWKNTVSKG